jgi:hypothetical protein
MELKAKNQNNYNVIQIVLFHQFKKKIVTWISSTTKPQKQAMFKN